MKLKGPVTLETTFAEYSIDEQIGEGGAGRVYGGTDDTGTRVAVKVLTQTTTDKRRRFKNEIGFLANNRHPNIVTVVDHGISREGMLKGPFYVMRRYDGSLRGQMAKISPLLALQFFSQMLDGVEAAHLLGVTHRDLKPENFLFDGSSGSLAVADFGVASFAQQQLLTLVETKPTQRLANFVYAAPEQRTPGANVGPAADIYALGLILNELFTGTPPHGTDYKTIATVSKEYEFLDPIVTQMIKQNVGERLQSITAVKTLIQTYQAEAVTLQRLSKINKTVIPVGSVDEPLAHEPPKLIHANWDNGTLRLTLDRPVTIEWVRALQNMGSYQSILGVDPYRFTFDGVNVSVPASEHVAQDVINNFKNWLPTATQVLKQRLEYEKRQEEAHRREDLRVQRETEERRLRVNRNLRI